MYGSKCRDDLKPCQTSFMKVFTGNFFFPNMVNYGCLKWSKYTSEIDT